MATGRRDRGRSAVPREEGKPLAEGRGEVYRAGQFFTYFAAEVLRNQGDLAESVRSGVEIDVRREPVGVVAIISPWKLPRRHARLEESRPRSPSATPWSGSRRTRRPASAVALTEIVARQDIPPGLFNLVTGPGAAVGRRLAESAGIDADQLYRVGAGGTGNRGGGHRQQ